MLLASPPQHRVSGNLYVRLREYLRSTECQAYYAPFDVHLHKPGVRTLCGKAHLIACDEKALKTATWYSHPGGGDLPKYKAKGHGGQTEVTCLGRGGILIIDPDNRKVLQVQLCRTEHQISEYRLWWLSTRCFPGLEVPVSAVFS